MVLLTSFPNSHNNELYQVMAEDLSYRDTDWMFAVIIYITQTRSNFRPHTLLTLSMDLCTEGVGRALASMERQRPLCHDLGETNS